MFNQEARAKAKQEATEAHKKEKVNHYNYRKGEQPTATRYSLTTTRGQTPVYLSIDAFQTESLLRGTQHVTEVHKWRERSLSDWSLGILSEIAVEQELFHPCKLVSSRYLGEKLPGEAVDIKIWLGKKPTRIGVKATTHENVERFDGIAYPVRRLSSPMKQIADYVIGCSVKMTYLLLSNEDKASLERMNVYDRVALASAEIGVWGAITRRDLLRYLNNEELVHLGNASSDFVEIPLDAFSLMVLGDIQEKAKQDASV